MKSFSPALLLFSALITICLGATSPATWPYGQTAASGGALPHGTAPSGHKDIMIRSRLTPGFDMGLDTSSGNLTSWLHKENDYFKAIYPKDQVWGAVFVSVGKLATHPTNYIDLSPYSTVSVEMKGEHGGETVDIGIRDVKQPPSGEETKLRVMLTNSWEAYPSPLASFSGTNLEQVYIVIEFVFTGVHPETIYFRNIRYLTDAVQGKRGSRR